MKRTMSGFMSSFAYEREVEYISMHHVALNHPSPNDTGESANPNHSGLNPRRRSPRSAHLHLSSLDKCLGGVYARPLLRIRHVDRNAAERENCHSSFAAFFSPDASIRAGNCVREKPFD